MSTAVASRFQGIAYFAADAVKTARGHQIDRLEDGTARVRGVEIFKAGTFRDSMGEQNTWTVAHLLMMVNNFNLLKDADIFTDVPVRRDHGYSLANVMGYFESLYVIGDRLLADIHVTEPDQVDKLARTTYRSVSVEVGMYVTNDETPYWPTVMGVAYVDIPAVEGLHSKNIPVAYFSRTDSTQEKPVTTENDRGAQRPSSFRIKGVETSDHAAVQSHIAELEARPAPAAFRVNGTETMDFTAVQAHITALEGFASETRDNGRKSFVTGLADGKSPKIAATQVETLTELAIGMSDEQFAKFKASYELAPALSLTANHGSDANKGGDAPAGGNGEKASEKLVLQEQLAMHRNAGMSEDEIQNTKAFKRLAQLNTQA
jgi:hypothetical protein